MKRVLSFLLSLMLVASMLAQDVSAAVEPAVNSEGAAATVEPSATAQADTSYVSNEQGTQDSDSGIDADPDDEQALSGIEQAEAEEMLGTVSEAQADPKSAKGALDEEDDDEEEVLLEAVVTSEAEDYTIYTEIDEETGEPVFEFKPGYHSLPDEGKVESVSVVGNNKLSGSFSGVNTGNSLVDSYTTPNLPNLRNQNPYGTCWAHSNMAMAEISMKKQELAVSPDYSEMHLAYFTYHTPTDSSGRMNGDNNWGIYDSNNPNFLELGGSLGLSSHVLASWVGAADETVASYDLVAGNDSYKYTSDASLPRFVADADAFNDATHLKNYYKVNYDVNSSEDMDAIKRIIRDCGAAGISYFALGPYQYADLSNGTRVEFDNLYNSTYNCYYCPISITTNHAVTIVGWDDNFSSSKFVNQPAGNGAWLIRNSWTTSTTDTENIRGYFWLSYYDKSIANCTVYGYEYDVNNDYDHNYQYDGCMDSGTIPFTGAVREANIFHVTSDTNERLEAASFCTENTNLDYQVDVYLNPTATNPSSGTLVSSVSGSTYYAGYYTVPLTTKVVLSPGDSFSIVVTFTKSGQQIAIPVEHSQLGNYDGAFYRTTAAMESGQSFYSSQRSSGTWYGWSDCYNGRVSNGETYGNLRIKAFTKDISSDAKHTVTFNANGGSCSPTTIQVITGSTYPTLPTPTRPGYDFDGWFTLSSGGSKVEEGDPVTITSNQTLYAHWTVKSFTVTFNANGGNCSTSSKQVTYGSTYPTLPTPTYSGYRFDGWYTDATGGMKVQAGDTVTITANQTLYAHWTKLITVTLKPNMTGTMSGGSFNVTSLQLPQGGKYTGLPTTARTSPTGYTFEAWYTSSSGGTKITQNTTLISNNDHTVYAHWTGKSVTVYFDAGTGASCSTTSKTVTYGQSYGTLPQPAKTNFQFAGWEDANGDPVTETSIVNSANAHTLYARWTGKSITVTLNAKGGTGAPSSINVTYGGTYTGLVNPTRPGYNFDGWWTTELSGGERVYGNSLVNINQAHTLYARWESKTYTISFDKNDGSSLSQNSMDVWFGFAYGNLPTASRTDYNFDGWYTAPSGGTKITSETIVSTDNFDPEASTHTLYAHWTQMVVVTLDKNLTGTMTDASFSVSSLRLSANGTYTGLPGTASTLPTGYGFDGWYTEPSGGTKITASDNLIQNANHTLYAHWKANTYTVTFNGNQGTVPSGQGSKTVTYDSTYGTLPTATRNGYRFDGWYNAQTGGTQITENTTVKITAAQTLYAHWTKLVTVTLNANGGVFSKSSLILPTDGTYTGLPTIASTSPAGYTFEAWYTELTGGTRITENTDVIKSSNHTLYAHWKANTYTVTFDPKGGTLGASEGSKTVTYDSAYGTLPTPTYEGNNFDGWYTEPTGGTQITENTTVKIIAAQTLYAHWTQMVVVTLDKNLTGTMTDASFSVSSLKLQAGEKYTGLPTSASTEPIGYKFKGWYTEPAGGTKITASDNLIQNTNHTLYAQWDARSYKVTFDANGGTLGGGVWTVNLAYDSPYGTLVTPTRKGYNFAGWYTEPTGGTPVTASTLVKIADAHTLYARWNAAQYKVTFDPNGGTITSGTGWKYVHYQDDYGELPTAINGEQVFKGWFTEKTGGTKITADTKCSISQNHTLYAHWSSSTNSGISVEGLEESYVYTGVAIKPAITVYDNDEDRQLTEKADYTVAYKNCTNVKPGAEIVVTGKGNYNNSIKVLYRIEPRDISADGPYKDEFAAADIYVAYNAKKAQKPNPVLYRNGKKLIVNKDYSISAIYVDENGTYVSTCQAPGKYTVTISGIGNYKGTRTITFTIGKNNQIPLTGATIKVSDVLWDNNFKYPASVLVKVKGKTLNQGTDYKILWPGQTDPEDNTISEATRTAMTNAGIVTFTVVATENGNYCGKVTGTYKIKGTELKNNWLSLYTQNFTYTGQEIEPEFDLFVPKSMPNAGRRLQSGEDKDYTVSYENNLKAGTATMIITGTGKTGYTGTVKKTFKISQASISEAQVFLPAQVVYEKGGNQPKPTKVNYKGMALTEGIDYSISYKKNQAPGTAQLVLTGKGNFKGTVAYNFEIKKQTLEDACKAGDVEIVVPDMVYTGKAGGFTVKPVLTDTRTGKRLDSKDYKTKFTYRYGPVEGVDNTYRTSVTTKEGGRIVSKKRQLNEEIDKADIIPVTNEWAVTNGLEDTDTILNIEIEGTGGFTGTVRVPFRVRKGDFSKLNIK
ncbi:MAG: InlB B-repeat-containing protein, partial [Lachnospiraceae bacterium]|nr:InlB B-repeat-containing protein [Lachnospiraceae bacterium]